MPLVGLNGVSRGELSPSTVAGESARLVSVGSSHGRTSLVAAYLLDQYPSDQGC